MGYIYDKENFIKSNGIYSNLPCKRVAERTLSYKFSNKSRKICFDQTKYY